MQISFDPYTLIFLSLTVFLVYRLRSILGQRAGEERSSRNQDASPLEGELVQDIDGDGEEDAPQKEVIDPETVLEELAPPNSPLRKNLLAMMRQDSGFNPRDFVEGAAFAYEIIIQAFAKGDKKRLQHLLSPDMYESFFETIAQRESRGERIESTFVSLDRVILQDAEIKDDQFLLKARFSCKLITATYDAQNAVIEGTPDKVTSITDTWVFSRSASNPDADWLLVNTEG